MTKLRLPKLIFKQATHPSYTKHVFFVGQYFVKKVSF